MAVTFIEDADVKRTAHGYSVLPSNVIVLQGLSGRLDATDITELAKDIEENNQLEPAVCWKNDAGWPVLAAGHRRYRAIVKINNETTGEKRRLFFNFIPAQTEAEAFDYTIRENRNRINPSPLDDGNNAKIYMERFGLNEEQVARKYYPGLKTPEELATAVREVKGWLKLLELSPEAQEELRKGFMSTSAALQLAAIPSRAGQNKIIEDKKAEGGKKLKVDDVKAAKEDLKIEAGIPVERKRIQDNTPVKLLQKYKAAMEIAGSLATEVAAKRFGRIADKEVIAEFVDQTLVSCSKLGVPLEASADKWAKANLDIPTVIDSLD